MLDNRNQRFDAQILVTTLVVLLLVSLTVVVITATISRNNRQVSSNIQYERNYNYAETRTIEVATELSSPEFDLSTLPALGIGQADCQLRGFDEYVCTFIELATSQRTVLDIFETNVVEDFSLVDEEYFDINLETAVNSSYNGNIQLKWSGSSAFDLGLIFVDSNQRFRTVHQIIDPNANSAKEVYDSAGSGNGFLNYNPIVSANEISINLGQLNAAKVPAGSKLKKIRVKAVNRESGTSITIRPLTNQNNLPNQVRRIEAFSYSQDSIDTSTPVLITQLPLEPAVPSPLTYVQNLQSTRSPICGNNVPEGKEDCDDGNLINSDGCKNDCTDICQFFVAGTEYCQGPCFADYGSKLIEQTGVGEIVGNYISNPGGFAAADLNNVDMVVYYALINSHPLNVSKMVQTLQAGKSVVAISDGCDSYCQGINPFINLYGISVNGNNGYIGDTGVGQTGQTLPENKGLSLIGASTTGDVVWTGSGAYASQVKTFGCQYRFPNGDCVWGQAELNNGAKISIITSVAATGGPGFVSDNVARGLINKLIPGTCE